MYLHCEKSRWIGNMRHSEFGNYVWNNIKYEFDEVFPATDILSKTGTIVETLTNRIKYGFGYYNFENNP